MITNFNLGRGEFWAASGTELEFQIKIEQIQILSMKYEICNVLVEIELMMH